MCLDADTEISPSVTINGAGIRLHSVTTKLLPITLPQNNIFEKPLTELNGLSVAHGYEYLTKPLAAGTLTIVNNLTFGDGTTREITTVINVT